jgi:hypothetical protein
MGTEYLCHGLIYFFSRINLPTDSAKPGNPATVPPRLNLPYYPGAQVSF